MSRYDLEIKKLNNDLKSGAIDAATYNRILEGLKDNYRNSEYVSTVSQYKQRSMFSSIFKLSLLAVSLILIIFFIAKNITFPTYETVTNLYNLPEPVQKNAEGYVIKYISGTPISISYVASYHIYGAVISTYDYYEYNLQNTLSPIDVALAWGKMADPENYSKIQWQSKSNRFLYHRIIDNSLLNDMTKSYIDLHFSNNHLIASSEEIKKLIKQIKVGDYISIEGYLVNVTYKKDNNYTYYWNSSTNRYDDGDGACEVIYVTNITWLQDQQ